MRLNLNASFSKETPQTVKSSAARLHQKNFHWLIGKTGTVIRKRLKCQIESEIQGRRVTSVSVFFPIYLFFRGGQKILSDVGHAGFARLTPWPNLWHDRAMKVGFISIFRRFRRNPPSESHTPDSRDSLIFFLVPALGNEATDRRKGLRRLPTATDLILRQAQDDRTFEVRRFLRQAQDRLRSPLHLKK